jgi:hypothetical protein
VTKVHKHIMCPSSAMLDKTRFCWHGLLARVLGRTDVGVFSPSDAVSGVL